MFLLDTNVLSELMRSRTAPEVAAWASRTPIDLLFTAAICQAEILAGVVVLPEGRRRRELDAAARAMFIEDFADRVLPFDTMAAAFYAEIFADHRRAGLRTATVDLMIASIARSHDASLITRNAGDFHGCGVQVVNPWAMGA